LYIAYELIPLNCSITGRCPGRINDEDPVVLFSPREDVVFGRPERTHHTAQLLGDFTLPLDMLNDIHWLLFLRFAKASKRFYRP